MSILLRYPHIFRLRTLPFTTNEPPDIGNAEANLQLYKFSIIIINMV